MLEVVGRGLELAAAVVVFEFKGRNQDSRLGGVLGRFWVGLG